MSQRRAGSSNREALLHTARKGKQMSEENKEPEAVEMKPQETETGSEATSTTATMVHEQPPEQPQLATKADVDACIDAVKELTKIIGELQAEIMKKLNAGKF
jgi:hypothetical protein